MKMGSRTKTTSSTSAATGANASSSPGKIQFRKTAALKECQSIIKTPSCTTSATYRSSSTSAIMATNIRPQTLNVTNPRETPMAQTQYFVGEALNAWRAKARCNVVPAERIQELFHELQFNPSERQISDMLQTAKVFARKGSRQWNGLTFGEFCVLAADLKRFRTSNFIPPTSDRVNDVSSNESDSATANQNQFTLCCNNNSSPAATELRSSKSLNNVGDLRLQTKSSETSQPVEVFLGGSCNPTTWRADVAIPALKKLGITFYNPQVSDWTPDLIELEHRAKEKARVLFFVMDSETRASAGAIEAAHIAGQNCKQLVLVLHPYKPKQHILNEPISHQEYMDLTRNQQILRELVERRGLPVLDNIPSGLQRTKDILAGIRNPPSNIASILVVVRGAFDRVNPVNEFISVEQCQRALSYLGYAQNLLNLENLNKIISTQRESLDSLQTTRSTKPICSGSTNFINNTSRVSKSSSLPSTVDIDFEVFCVLSAYLSVLQQEIHESGCISPIKGTNVPPPPVYLTNMQGDESLTVNFYSKHIFRTASKTSVPAGDDRQSLPHEIMSRDSGTSSPQPTEQQHHQPPLKSKSAIHLGKHNAKMLLNVELFTITTTTTAPALLQSSEMNSIKNSSSNSGSSSNTITTAAATATTEEESDSNDSVFSSSSSINSMNYCNDAFSGLDFRDVYLGGSCVLRTKWRQECGIPYLKANGVTFHMPALHESIQPSQLDMTDKTTLDDARPIRSRRKARGEGSSSRITGSSSYSSSSNLKKEYDDSTNTTSMMMITTEESFNWALPAVRPNLFNPTLLDSSRVLLFVITNETRSLAPMTLAAHCIGLMYNVVLSVQMLPEDCVISNEKLTPAAIKDYNRGRSYLIDLAKRQGVPVFNDLKSALECTVEKVKACNSRNIV